MSLRLQRIFTMELYAWLYHGHEDLHLQRRICNGEGKKATCRETIRGVAGIIVVYFGPSTGRALQPLRPVDLAKFLAKFKPCWTAR